MSGRRPGCCSVATVLGAALVLALAACRESSRGPVLAAVDGSLHAPLARPPGAVHVLVFASHECPIANAYAPTLRELAALWAGQPLRLYLAYVDPDLDTATAAQHARDYALPGTVLLDPRQDLARAVGASRTPEAFVLADAGVVYRGRIDDQWHGFGARAQTATHHELRDAVASTLAGRPVAVPRTEAVGCLLPEPRR